MVLCILSPTTTPTLLFRLFLSIAGSGFSSSRDGPGFPALTATQGPDYFCFKIVKQRAISRRRLRNCIGLSILCTELRKESLKYSSFSSPSLCSMSALVISLNSCAFISFLTDNVPFDDFAFDRQLMGRQPQGLVSHLAAYPADLEHDPAAFNHR